MQIKKKLKADIISQLEIQSMVLLAVVFLFIFAYLPMYGLRMAFWDFNILRGFKNAPFVALKYFEEFFTDINLPGVMKNTFFINLLGLAIGFPMPILLALFLNELRSVSFKRFAQTVSYLPYFLSWVIFGGIALELLAPTGVVNDLMLKLGLFKHSINFFGVGSYFYVIINTLNIIKTVGYGSILYVAAIAGIDQDLYEAAHIDGCGRFRRMWHITLPLIIGTIVIMLIFQISAILNTGMEQLLLLQNPMNITHSETLDTYVYKIGIGKSRFSYATAVGLLKSIVSVILLVFANTVSVKLTEKGLF